eukprot:m.340631 g.340631  ORF g.340631 m.340631 type:complete len:72 (+) comp16545_c0_seq15:5714-5929(+)
MEQDEPAATDHLPTEEYFASVIERAHQLVGARNSPDMLEAGRICEECEAPAVTLEGRFCTMCGAPFRQESE